MSVEKLERKAAVGVAQLSCLLRGFLVSRAGKDNPGVEGIEESDNERSIVVYQQRSGDSYSRSRARILLVLPKEQLFSLIE